MLKTHIQRVLTYIEEHLKDDSLLDNATLARIAGYSEYHFLRVFRDNVNLTPADYIRKRRITEIVKHIDNTKAISDIAFEYGFNSRENFTRAFKNEHKILPTEFKTTNCSLRLFEPFEFDAEFPRPEVSICYLEGFSLTAYPFDDDFAPNCWNRYNIERRSFILSGNSETEDYGAMIWNFDKNKLDYFIGVKSQFAKKNTQGTIEIQIEGGFYAVFETVPSTQHSFVDTIRKTWNWINNVWLTENGYKRRNCFELERYTETSETYTETIYIPITKEN